MADLKDNARTPRPTVLIIDDDAIYRGALSRSLRREYSVREVSNAAEARTALSPLPDSILLDMRLIATDQENRDGVALLRELRELAPDVPVLMNTAYGDIETAVECMRLGATDFVQKRNDLHEVKARLARALEHRRLTRRVAQLEADLERVAPFAFIAESPALHQIHSYVTALAQEGNATVLVRGETGTGKEVIARALHSLGRRRNGPFVPVVLPALPASLIETELFGYEQGAFTDAQTSHAGKLEQAHGGILVLDEIGEAEPGLQTKLLRFLEEREFTRLGGTISIPVDVQVIAMTNADITTKMQQGHFREDLYYRLQVHEIIIPPLRERIEDIEPLARRFMGIMQKQGRRVESIAPEAMALLESFPWPGNVRQLRNALESAAFWAGVRGRDFVTAEDLPVEIRAKILLPT